MAAKKALAKRKTAARAKKAPVKRKAPVRAKKAPAKKKAPVRAKKALAKRKAPVRAKKAPAKRKVAARAKKAPAKKKAPARAKKAPAKKKAPARAKKAPAKKKAPARAKKAPAKKKTPARAKKAPAKRKAPVRSGYEPEKLRPWVPIVDRNLQSSNWAKSDPANLSEIFQNILEAQSGKGPFEADDVLIFNHGIKFLGSGRKIDQKFTEKLARIASEKYMKLKIAETKAGTEVYLFLGDKMKLRKGVEKSFERRQKTIRKIFEELQDYWGHVYWWLWYETEESLYE